MFCNTYIDCNQLLVCIGLGPKFHGTFMHRDVVPTPLPGKFEQKSFYSKFFISCEIILKFEQISVFIEIETECFVRLSSIYHKLPVALFAPYHGAFYPTRGAKWPNRTHFSSANKNWNLIITWSKIIKLCYINKILHVYQFWMFEWSYIWSHSAFCLGGAFRPALLYHLEF